jgi:hypothetical protein
MAIAPITTPVLPPAVADHAPSVVPALDRALSNPLTRDPAPVNREDALPAEGKREDAPPAVGKLEVAADAAVLNDGKVSATEAADVIVRSAAVKGATEAGAPAASVLASELFVASMNA